MKAEIISIGTELMLGEIIDTNAACLAGKLPSLGIELKWVSQVGDDMTQLSEVFQRAWKRSDLILTTGGLGPTDDDMTRQAIADLFGETIQTDPSLEKTLRERFVRFHMEMPVTNLRQAGLIPSSRSIPNDLGTAPGWWVEKDGRILAAMPGPPRELQGMWEKQVEPRLRQRSNTIILCKTFKTSGMTEADVGERTFHLFPDNPSLGVYARIDGIQLRLTAKASSQSQARGMLADGEAQIRKAPGDYIWGTDEDTIESVIGGLLTKRGLTLAIMEDYTGGLLTAGVTEVPGLQAFFKGGLVANSVEAKIAGGVSRNLLSRDGPAGAEIARAMAESVRQMFKADIGMSTSSLEVTETWPNGVVHIGLTNSTEKEVMSRAMGKRRIVNNAWFELRKFLIAPGAE